jgi:putative ABC transport system permease protein
MFKNYFKSAWRNISQNKTFSAINIFGLATGLMCCLLISMYLYKEFSYDTQHEFGKRLYQLETLGIKDGKENREARTPAPMAPAMQQEFPEVESYTRLIDAFQDDKTLLQYGQGSNIKSFYETKAFFADSTFFRLFTYRFKEGNPSTALNEPNTVVLSQEIAKKLFGNQSAINKVIHIKSTTNGDYDYKVTGVFIPSTTPSHIDAHFFMSMKGGDVGEWVSSLTDMVNNNMFYSYLLLKPGADPKQLEGKFADFINRHAGADLKASGRFKKQYLLPVQDVHLYAPADNVSPGGNLTYLYILLSIAVITLIIACVNFMNLSTARSSKRAVEIGVRKVLGAERNSLIKQFLAQAVLLALISFLIAIVLTFLLRPSFEQLSGDSFSFSLKEYLVFLFAFVSITVLTGLLAGFYPAFYLSAFKPIQVLKGKFSNSLGAVSFRKVLVVFQFVIAVALIIASVAIRNQMNFLRNVDLGFNTSQQIIIPLRTSNAKEIYPALKDGLLANSSIQNAGASIYYPGIRNATDWLLYKQGNSPDRTRDIVINHIDNSFLQTLNVQLETGRLFSKDFPGDTANRMIINEQAVKDFGFASAQDAIGKNIVAKFGNEPVYFPIIGIVKDFHFEGLQSHIKPFGFLLNRRPDYNYLIAHIKAGNVKVALKTIKNQWAKLDPNEPFEYSFLDQDFQKNYEAEERLAAMIKYFTIIAIAISCLGLFGLTTFSVEQRVKEIGIRKVLGASTPGIVSLLSKDFLKLVLMSFTIASPLAYYFIQKWLQSFAYRAPFTVWIILIAWSAALLIAFLTIAIQSIKAAMVNPVKSLRSE